MPTAAPEAVAATASDLRVVVEAFEFSGNTRLGIEQLSLAVAPFLRRPLSLADLQAAAAAVAAAYREAGWLARVVLPVQTIAHQTVRLQIIEARLGAVHIDGAATRISGERLRPYFSARQAQDEPLNVANMERALALINDLPGLQVAASLHTGQADGRTDLTLQPRDQPLLVGDIGIDNMGSSPTGALRQTARLALNSPQGLGEQWTGQLIHSQGSDYARLAASLPWGSDGWRVGAHLARLNYRIVAPEFKALQAQGGLSAVGLDASYPLLRSSQSNIYLNLGLERTAFDNRTTIGTSSQYHTEEAGATLSGNWLDAWGGAGASNAYLTLTLGRLHLSALDPGEHPSLEGGFRKLRYGLARNQALANDWSLFAALHGQWAGQALDSSQKFYLGGPYGVRAYPVNEGAGEQGQSLNAELRWRWAPGWVLAAFYDAGQVRLLGAPAVASSTWARYAGYGLSLGWQGGAGWDLRATWARRLGANPLPSSSGQDQDGSLHRNRWWLSAAWGF